MNRRELFWRAGAAAVSVFAPARFVGATEVAADLTLREDPEALRIPADFIGLSYELAQLSDPTFFSVNNEDLVAYFRLLSANGVLRLGGNTSEFCWFKANGSTLEPVLHVPPGNLDANWMPHRLFEVTPEAIDALAGFVRATGWRLIYGVNFGNSTPQRAAEEAACVAQKVGGQLEFFQIGNEPDLYTKASNGTRPPGWSFADYVREWTSFANAIAARVSEARFGGPDVAASSDWVTRFSAEVPSAIASRLVALTGHYYAEGPPDDPRVTIERLLAGDPKIAMETKAIVAAARGTGRVYRMSEGNSCYRGGKPGMSDAFAAALWAGDYLLELASLGCAGVNLHGGRSEFLTAGLGGHTPGMEVAKTPQAVQSGFYSPIQSEPGRDVKAMPVFYGMMLANQFAGATMLRVEGDLHGVNAPVYAGRRGNETRIAVLNKDAATPLVLTLRGGFVARTGRIWRLQGPGLDATNGVRLAAAEIDPHARWSARAEAVEASNGTLRLRVPEASAALLFLE
ncbi:MAG: glycosyl hydrolase family 79 C-terminal domain-containing protein [Terracidiphilus sp.]